MNIDRSGNKRLSFLREEEPEQAIALVAKAVFEAGGRIAEAARRLKISRRTLSRWASEDEDFAKAIHAARRKAFGVEK